MAKPFSELAVMVPDATTARIAEDAYSAPHGDPHVAQYDDGENGRYDVPKVKL
jgi:hypothetical protein